MKLVGINNNKGFTLVEILSVLVLIGLLFGLGVPAVSKISKNMKARTYNQKINLIEEAGKLWGQDNKALLQKEDCEIESGVMYKCIKITIKELIEEDYLDSETKENISYKDPIEDKEIIYNYVYIYKKNNRVYAKYKDDDRKVFVYANDNKDSGEYHKTGFKIFADGTGTIEYKWSTASTYSAYNPSNGINITTSDNNKTLNVRFTESGVTKTVDYQVKIDTSAPQIRFFDIEHNIDYGASPWLQYGLLKLKAYDNGEIEYKFSTNSNCSGGSWQKIAANGSEKIITQEVREIDGLNKRYYACVRDSAGNEATLSSGVSSNLFLYNCNVTGDYYFQCYKPNSSTRAKYTFVNINVVSTGLKIYFPVSGKTFTQDLNGSSPYTFPNQNHSYTYYNCDSYIIPTVKYNKNGIWTDCYQFYMYRR